jgi:hypothetical protein
MYLSQPALSRQIRALERVLGCELLRRSTHRVELTVAGSALLDRARRLLTDLDEARRTELRRVLEASFSAEEVEPGELEPSERQSARSNGAKAARRSPAKSDRPARKIDPPSWKRVSKRALFFGPLIFLAFSVLNSKQPVATRLLLAILYTGFFIPFMYLMDRAMYRTYLRRTGQAPPPRAGLRR